MSAIILYARAHFYRRPDFGALIGRLESTRPDHRIAQAYEDMTGPALPETIDRLVADGVGHITVVPCGLPADLSITKWLPGALAAHLEARSHSLRIEITRPIEAFLDFGPALDEALADSQRICANDAEPSIGKPGWTEVPDHNLQVFFCVGTRCAHHGAHEMFAHLRRAMRSQRALANGPRRVMCARSSCMFPCNQGPMMVVHPDGVWYGKLTEARIDQIVAQHFLEGRIVEDAVIHQLPQKPLTD